MGRFGQVVAVELVDVAGTGVVGGEARNFVAHGVGVAAHEQIRRLQREQRVEGLFDFDARAGGRAQGILVHAAPPHNPRHHLVPAPGACSRHEVVLVERFDRPHLRNEQAQVQGVGQLNFVGLVGLVAVKGLLDLIGAAPSHNNVFERHASGFILVHEAAGGGPSLVVHDAPVDVRALLVLCPQLRKLVDFEHRVVPAVDHAHGKVVVPGLPLGKLREQVVKFAKHLWVGDRRRVGRRIHVGGQHVGRVGVQVTEHRSRRERGVVHRPDGRIRDDGAERVGRVGHALHQCRAKAISAQGETENKEEHDSAVDGRRGSRHLGGSVGGVGREVVRRKIERAKPLHECGRGRKGGR